MAGRAAGEHAGLVDFNNYKTFNRLQHFQQTTIVPGLSLYTKPQQEDVLKEMAEGHFFQRQDFQQTTIVPTDYKTSNR